MLLERPLLYYRYLRCLLSFFNLFQTAISLSLEARVKLPPPSTTTAMAMAMMDGILYEHGLTNLVKA